MQHQETDLMNKLISKLAIVATSLGLMVGAANAANHIPLVIPCHRVLGADGSLTGFGGGMETKRWLLAHEAQQRSLF